MTAYQEGFDARLSDMSPAKNPYANGTKERRDWTAGWEEQDRHLKARDGCLRQIGWFG